MKKRQIVKRDGSREEIKLSKIIARVDALSENLEVQPDIIAQKVIEKVIDGITSEQIDHEIAVTAFSLVSEHNHYSYLASKVIASGLHKDTPGFYNGFKLLMKNDVLDKKYLPLIKKIGKKLEKAIVYERDLENFDYMGLRTLVDSKYLLRIKEDDVVRIIERPQDMYMRAAIQIHADFTKEDFNLKEIVEEYHFISQKNGTYATPTLLNSCTNLPQLSSCFLLQVKDDSIDGIYDTLKDTAKISQSSGGIGLNIHDIRSNGSRIVKTNGFSRGIFPMLKVFQETARYVDQGGGKRKGSFSIYLEPWHKDIFDLIDCSNKHMPTKAAPDLFTAIWACDLFMERVEQNAKWTLFCPNDLKKLGVNLSEMYDSPGDKKFTETYERLEREGHGETVEARLIWEKWLEANASSGLPYMLYKDSCNYKSNQKNLGVIKSSNLCAEIIEFTSPDEIAVCNLASLSLPKFVIGVGSEARIDKEALGAAVQRFIRGLNNVIDVNYYPLPEMITSNMKNRPVGLGVQGLADVFMMAHAEWGSHRSRLLQRDIFETIYYHATLASMEIAKKHGPYESFKGSPASEGKLQFDFYEHQDDIEGIYKFIGNSGDYDWDDLKKKVKKHGLRNSLMVACMPTGSTSQMLGNFEGINPVQRNIFSRTLLNGEFMVVNKHLIKDLKKLDLWDEDLKNEIIQKSGSIQDIKSIPASLKEIYKTAYEIGNKNIIMMAADRQRYICQSQSMNLFSSSNDGKKLSVAMQFAWKVGLKTGKYYLYQKSRASAQVIQTSKKSFFVDKSLDESLDPNEGLDDCEMCGS